MSETDLTSHPATAWVNLDRIGKNFDALKRHAGSKTVIPVLKADAYGHGAVAVGRALEKLGAAMVAVAYVDEGVALRRAGLTTPILVLTGFAPGQLAAVAGSQLTPVIGTPEHVTALKTLPHDEGQRHLRVHVKLDTGMSRLGFSLREIEPVIHRLEDMETVEVEGFMTHLASADEDRTTTERQLDDFDEGLARIETLGVRPAFVHAANSAGMAYVRDTHTAVRPGLLLYGLSPRPLSSGIAVEPAMDLRARVALLKKVAAGTPVSYGGRFKAERDSLLAIINAGYADGVPRTDLMRTEGALRRGQASLKVAGTVCMDLTLLDATEVPEISVGEEVTIFGEAPTAWDLAGWAGTNAWQILTGVGPRVPRRYILDGKMVSEDLA